MAIANFTNNKTVISFAASKQSVDLVAQTGRDEGAAAV
jgi:hypothetical protein